MDRKIFLGSLGSDIMPGGYCDHEVHIKETTADALKACIPSWLYHVQDGAELQVYDGRFGGTTVNVEYDKGWVVWTCHLEAYYEHTMDTTEEVAEFIEKAIDNLYAEL